MKNIISTPHSIPKDPSRGVGVSAEEVVIWIMQNAV
jgi:hypothetical protein